MEKTFVFHPENVCSREMRISYDGDTITRLEVVGGCQGNLRGISALIKGMKSSLFMTLQDNSFLSYPEVNAVAVSDGGSCYHNLIKVDQGQVTKWMSLLGQADSFALEVALIDPLTANAFYVPWQNGYAMVLSRCRFFAGFKVTSLIRSSKE